MSAPNSVEFWMHIGSTTRTERIAHPKQMRALIEAFREKTVGELRHPELIDGETVVYATKAEP